MKTWLRHSTNGLYVKGVHKWTAAPDQAYNFRFVDRAIKFVERWQLAEVELAFAFDDSEPAATLQVAEPSLARAA